MTTDPTPDAEALEKVRETRRGVRRASVELEEALARPAGMDARAWSADVAERLAVLAAAFERHAEQSEGPQGLLGEIVEVNPRVVNAVQQIKREHVTIQRHIVELEAAARGGEDAGVEPVRERALRLLQALSRHRQRGADLLYEAYSVDIEGSD